ncbi:MAG TPA: hypothetical protein PLB81_01995 [Deltaproteobacteria bacterium]|nr:hypothetical protein [Deltaproteobacteria bacterium]
MRVRMQTIIACAAMLMIPARASALWEVEAKLVHDSNVNRSVVEEESDTSLDALVTYNRVSDPKRRLDWTLRASVEGAAYAQTQDLDFLGLSLSPAVVVLPANGWRVRIGPFVQARTVRDNDQSAWALGAAMNLEQQWSPFWYSGEYYAYTDSRARDEVYAFTEHSVGIFVGQNWTGSLFSEIGYEYASGESFQTIPTETITTVSVASRGRGYRRGGYSTTFGADVVRDDVTRYTGTLTIGYAAGSFTPYLGYRYSRGRGDLGTTNTHEASAGLRYMF